MKRLLALVLALTIGLTACSTAWLTTLDTILAAAAPALINILQIIAIAKGQPVNAALSAKITADAATIKQLATDFANASAAAAPTACAQLQAAITTYSADQAQVLALAQVNDSATQQKIAVLAGLVSSTVSAIIAAVPQCQAAPAAVRGLRAEPPLNMRNFIKDYNSALVAKTGNAAVDAMTPRLKLHQHSAFARAISLGILQ